MPVKQCIVIGASAGGIEVMRTLLPGLPADFPAPILFVLHQMPTGRNALPDVLSRGARIEVVRAEHGMPLRNGRVYLAPPDHHLLVRKDHLELDRGPRVNHSRPAIDVLFDSAAQTFGPAVIGIVLSGLLADGAAGLAAIKRAGGIAIVQDPQEAQFASMPRSAITQAREIDHILPAAELAPMLVQLTADAAIPAEETTAMQREHDDLIQQEMAEQERGERNRESSIFTCPDCGGVLWEIEDGGVLTYRCHVGHQLNADNLYAGHREALERALWTAVRALEESASLSRRMAVRMRSLGSEVGASRYQERATEAERHADVVRGVIQGSEYPPADLEDQDRAAG